MALRGPTLFAKNTQTDSPPAGVCDIGTAAVSLTSGAMAGNTSSPVIYQVFPTAGSGALGTATAANTTLANNKGWWLPPTTDMAGSPTALRWLRQSAAVAIQAGITATGLSGNDTFTVSLYKRASGGGLTLVQQATATAPNGALGTTTVVTATITLSAQQTYTTGETFYLETYVTVVNQALAAGSASISYTSGTPWTFNSPNGITYLYPLALAATATVTAAIQRVVSVKRSATTTLSAALQRVVMVRRSATTTLSAVLVRNFPRAFTATTTVTGFLRLQLPQSVLNRLGGGGRKVTPIFVIED